MKNIRLFLSENFPFLFVKFSIYFNRRVFEMELITVVPHERSLLNNSYISTHYENMPFRIYKKISPPKTENFQIKNSDFLYFCSKHRLWYSLEQLQWGGSNEYQKSIFLSRNKKNNLYPCKPQFYYIKGGLRGSELYRHVFMMTATFLISQYAVLLFI